MTALGAALLLITLMWPNTAWAGALTIVTVFYLGGALFRAGMMALASWPAAPRGLSGREPEIWPRYTILAPLYREARVVPQFAAAMRRLDYPKDRLEVLLIVEADDAPTCRAAMAESEMDARFRVVVVPPFGPRTKPKACNYALAEATGDYVVIFDAEDIPDPGQLKAAARHFAQCPLPTACLQAALVPYNGAETWITRAFALEYLQWFEVLMPGLARAGLPIPLGGTSNHFRIEALRASGAWDAFNVTEDADLGLRLARLGYSVDVLQSTTFEEACRTWHAWFRQRTRWIKGYLLTWAVHMQAPIAFHQTVGAAGFWSTQILIGGAAITGLLNPWLVLAAILSATGLGPAMPLPLSIALGLTAAILMAMLALSLIKRRWWGLWTAALSAPLYWFLLSVAAYAAVWELWRRPEHWAKTEHGLTRMSPAWGAKDAAE